MGQKVNPHGIRVGVIKNWDSRWFAKNYGDNIVSDAKIRKYLKTELMDAGIAKIEIERDSKRVRVFVDCAKPGLVIGKGGSVIQKITADTNTKIDIEDDGSICIAAINSADGERARKLIEGIAKDPEVGDMYYGKVTRIMTFGAFVEFAPGKEGLIHISKLADRRVGKVEDVLNIGDETWVKVIEIDDKGRINLSRKDALKELEEKGEYPSHIK